MSDARGARLSESLLSTLVSILDLVVLERMHGGSFRQVGADYPPAWFTEAFHHADRGAPVTIVQAFPVLDSLISEAEAFWERTAFGRLDGEAFVVAGRGEDNLALATIAIALEGRHFLLIQRVAGFDEKQRILQRAREQALAHETVVREIDELRRPLAKAGDAIGKLTASALDESQRALVSSLAAELDALRGVVDRLPKLPPGVSARRR